MTDNIGQLKEAIKALKNFKAWYYLPSHGSIAFDANAMNEAIDTVVAELEKHLITSGWIDVSVQMPEEKQEVLAYNGYRVVHTSWKDFTDQNAHWFRSNFDYWMPMIELPKTRNKNE
jgi:hypothetical protein